MKVFVVFKGYWLYELQVYKVFLDENKAVECRNELLKQRDVRAYINVYEIEDSK